MSDNIQFTQFEFQSGNVLPVHYHDEAQILYARSGILELTVGSSLIVLPSSRLAWIPPGLDHGIRFRTQTELRSAYIVKPDRHTTPEDVKILQASELFRATFLRLSEDKDLVPEYKNRLGEILLQEMTYLKSESFALNLPTDPRALRVARFIFDNPGEQADVTTLSQMAACGTKTLGRLFLKQTGLTLKLWRLHARLLAGLEHLEMGHSITETAYLVGYSTPSAFTEAFRLTFGYPPSKRSEINEPYQL